MLNSRWADEQARRGFTYKADPASLDTWRSHRAEVQAGRQWVGDCDDLASTVLDLLAEGGFPLDQMFRLFVSSTRSQKQIDHMVGCVLDEDRYYIVGDTFGPIYEAVRMDHTGIFYQRMNEVRDDIYRGGVPWNK